MGRKDFAPTAVIAREQSDRSNPDSPIIHVVVGLIYQHGKILIAKRPKHVEQGDLWEFPGGKREAGETAQQALARELKEEVGITVMQSEPVLQFEHTYPEKTILFDCWQVNEFQGKVTSCEGQPIKWVIKADLLDYDFPVANQRLIAQLL